MHTDVATTIEAMLSHARRARADDDLPACIRCLRDAAAASEALEPQHRLRSVVAWRRAKAAYDLGATDEMLDCLAGVLALDEPFADYPQGLKAAEPLARRWWDERGYGHPLVQRLWEAFIDAWRRGGDPWLAACGEAQLAWDWACSGRIDELTALLVRRGGQGPREFGQGPTKHPRALDASTSVFWSQMDLSRTALRAAVWADDESLAREAAEVYADALAEADVAESDDYWFLETVGRAERRFGWRGDVAERWLAAAPALEHERAPLHRAIAEAEGRGRRSAALEALPLADAAGPEWGVDLRLLVHRGGDDPDGRLLDEARRLAERTGLGVFRRALQDPG
jgi:hypothetical protein